MENFSQATDAAAAAMDSQGSAVAENEKRLESFESKINNIKGAWQEVVLEFVDSEKVKDILDKVNDGLRALADNKGAVNTITDLVEAFVIFQGMKLGAGALGSLTTSLWSVIKKIKDLRAGILFAGTATSTMNATLSAVGLTLNSLITPATVFLGVMTAISGAIVLYKKYQQAPTEQLEKDKKTLEETRDTYKQITKEHDELLDRQKDLKSQGLDLNKAEKERLKTLEKQTKELEEQVKKQKEKIASDTVGTLKYTQKGTKTVHKQGSTFDIPTKEVLKGQEAFEAMSKAIADATEQYKNGEITLTEYKNRTGELNTQLDSVYDSYLDVINSGGDLNEQDTENYNTLVNLKVAWVNAQGASSNYAKALKSVSSDVKQAIYITDTFKESLVQVGGKYYFVSQAAKDSAMQQLKTEMSLTQSVIEQVSSRISARTLEYDSIKDFNQEVLKHASPTAAGKFYESETGQAVQTYYKLKKNLDALKKIKVKGGGIDSGGDDKSSDSSGGSGSGKGSGDSEVEKKKKDKEEKEKKDAKARLKRYKKWLENYEATQREYYQKGIISASEYYSNVQKKGEYYYNLLKKRGKNYASAASSMWSEYKDKNSEAVKELFNEIDYRYEEGKISGQEYYKELWKYAKKFYKNGKLDFSEYRDYVNKGYKAMFEDIKKQYDNGEITAEQYFKKVKKAEKDANASITSARKKGKITKSTASSTRNDLTQATVDALNQAAQALKEAAIKAAEAAVEAAEKKLKEAQARQDKANTFISALQFYATEQQELIDKEIDGYNEQIDALNEKLSLMEEQNEALDKQAERMKLVKELEEAKKQKTVRVYDSRLGWVWVSDPKAVKDAQTALDEFDTERKREQEKQAIQDQIDAINDLIKKKEQEKQAYQDVINEQSKALERYNIEAELGKTIEAAIFAERTQNFNNWKDSYVSGVQEVIAATEAVNTAQSELDSANAALDAANNMEVPVWKAGVTTKTGSVYYYTDDMSAVEKWNAGQAVNIKAREDQGYKVETWTGADGKVHYTAKKPTTPKKPTTSTSGSGGNKPSSTKSNTGGNKPSSTKSNTGGKKPTSIKSNTGSKKPSSNKKKASGSLSLPQTGIYNINELGDELIVPPKGNFDYLKKGTGVIPADLTQNLMDWGKFNPKNLIGNQPSVTNNDHSITIQSLTVKSDNAKDFVRQLQNLAIVRS